MKETLQKILAEAIAQIQKADSLTQMEEIRVKMLGKKSPLTEILRSMGKLSPEERKELGQDANQVREQIESALERKLTEVKAKAQEEKFRQEKIDVTEPGKAEELGAKHLITITIDEISRIFMSMGFSVSEGPEVDTVFNNFDALNAPKNHPSRAK